MQHTHSIAASPARRCPGRGFTLIEVLVVLTVIGVLVAMCVPSYKRALEQSRVDVAAANLRAIWSAQRLYWLEYHVYSADLSQLRTLGLLSPEITQTGNGYTYEVTAADETTLQCSAERTGSTYWSGALAIDQNGTVSGAITSTDATSITPGFQ